MGKLVKLEERAPAWALARLNRITGLTFSRLPVSLLAAQREEVEPVRHEPCADRAINSR